MLIDTHCHLDFKDFDPDREAVLDRAVKAGVARIINVGSSLEGSRRAVELANKYETIYASVGVHPHDASQVTDKVIEDIKTLAKEKKVVAIGEVGLDYYRLFRGKTGQSPAGTVPIFPGDDEIKEGQQAAFRKFIQLAHDMDLPLIIHSREADDDTIGILKEYSIPNTQYPIPIRGVIHCFSGNEKLLKEFLKLGFYVSFTCNLTFKKAEALREVAKTAPIERVLLETDAPYLAPEGMRGRRNEPAYLTYLVDEWVKLTGLSKEDIERITTHNANTLFKLNLKKESPKIAYEIRDSLYLNITNECTNNCYFCVRAQTAFVKGHNLKLDKEPTSGEILEAVGDAKRYKEIVFCGYGEPTAKLDTVKAVCRELKKKGMTTRLVTNGHGDLINKRPIVKELAGLVDNVSVSLNTDKEDLYNKVCKPAFGGGTYKAVMKFIKDCVESGIKAEVTCLDLPGVDLKECASIAKELSAEFRLRKIGIVG
ncbi:MAG: YchF/TatD family DNA exonuclease [Candidatus Omnitrophica bacterium]|nr:YchF/TatD family DNA exonuclease [Candidatus Omnitrophota bacterium]